MLEKIWLERMAHSIARKARLSALTLRGPFRPNAVT
jgi:hypothetical protein